jgi:hypothetical protein
MRGKKSDPEFVSRFIQDAVRDGVETSSAIVDRAKKMMEQIDEEIRIIENKKVVRSKLLDVIASFEVPVKDKTEDAKLLPFFDLKYPMICKEICDELYEAKAIPILSWMVGWKYERIAELNFCIKQLIEAKIITRIGDQMLFGERFEEYFSFVLNESK